MPHLFRSTLRVGVLALALAGCRDATGPDNNVELIAGEYILMTIDGDPLPVIVDQVGEDIAEVTAGSVELEVNGSFVDETTLRFTISGVVTTESVPVGGTWTVASNGTTVTFRPSDNSGDYTMTWDGEDQLTQLFEGFTLVYLRADVAALRTPRP